MHSRTIAVVGLGYAGLPVAIAFGRISQTIGFDIDPQRISELKTGFDKTGEYDSNSLLEANLTLSTDPDCLLDADFIIVTVPTPIDEAKNPDLSPLASASRTVGPRLQADNIVVYESTVYPGVTEEFCVPILEETSRLRCGEDFSVGYSPERINPGDRTHALEHVVKIVSGWDDGTLDAIATTYEAIISAGIYRAPSIKVAEAAKVIENTQRDLNIALMNELAMIFDRLDIDTSAVLEAAGTKWNFLPFSPGLVGGHCIGVDPYYLTHKASLLGYHPQVILAGRRINDGMGVFVATQIVKSLSNLNLPLGETRVSILGLTFKENVSDLRNTGVTGIIRELNAYGIKVQCSDSRASSKAISAELGIDAKSLEQLPRAHCVVLAAPHREYTEAGWGLFASLLEKDGGIVVDVHSALPLEGKPTAIQLWRL